MEIILDTFDERIEDIEIYIEYLAKLEPMSLENKLQNILLANGYLLIYNLLEATIQSICTQIHTTIEKENLQYSSLSESLQLIYWETLHKTYDFKDSQKFKKQLIETANILLSGEAINVSKHSPVQGNITATQIRKVAKLYGFEHSVLKKSKEELLIKSITSKRQILAHGESSFSSLGSEIVISELQTHFEEAKNILEKLIKNVEEYIKTKQYMKQEDSILS